MLAGVMMSKTNLLLVGGVIVGGYFLLKSFNTSPGSGSSIQDFSAPLTNLSSDQIQATNLLNSEKIALIKAGKTIPTPTNKPSYKREQLSENFKRTLTGVIPKITNTMGVTPSVSAALRGTISPLTGKVRV